MDLYGELIFVVVVALLEIILRDCTKFVFRVKNKTRGLLGNWSHDLIDDLTTPDGLISSISNLNNFEAVHKDFAIKWLLEDREDPSKGAALFHRESGRTASYYNNRTFEPEWRKTPEEFLPTNRYVRKIYIFFSKNENNMIGTYFRSKDIERAHDFCGDSYQCQYDYAMSLNRDLAHFTRNYYDTWTQLRETNLRRSELSFYSLSTTYFCVSNSINSCFYFLNFEK